MSDTYYNLDPGETRFVQDYAAFPTGKYTVGVQHAVDDNGTALNTYGSDDMATVQVSASQYTLGTTEIKQAYPATGDNGPYEGTIPHIVFTKKSLPWQWRIMAEKPTDADELAIFNKATWMFPMLLSADELAGCSVQTMTLGDLTSSGSDTILTYPDGTFPTDDDALASTISVIDVPVDTFKKLAPSGEDLTYLGHARHSMPTNTPLPDDVTVAPFTSAVLSNRLSETNAVNTVHLVSLQHLYNYLPTADGTTYTDSANIATGITTVRLISLHSWNYYCMDSLKSFDEYFEEISLNPNSDVESAGLQMPEVSLSDEAQTTLVNTAHAMGYAMLNYHTRNGADALSWYRGPLLPFSPENVEYSLNSTPDALLRYNPNTGLFDASYAAAWQLGQLLGLQNQSFANTLNMWQNDVARSVVSDADKTAAESTYADIFTDGVGENQTTQFTTNVLSGIVDNAS